MKTGVRGPTLAVALVGILLAACTGGDAEPSTGPTVELFGPFRGAEAELLAESLEDFEATSGISIRYTGTGAFVADLESQVRNANPPDIAFIPQPGLITELARGGAVLPLPPAVVSVLEENYDDQILSTLGEVDGESVAVPFRVNVKSLVWYRPDVFARRGLEVPGTLAELEALVEQIEDEGTSPWCFGIVAQGATGWVATDWTEEMVLRLSGADVYDQWVAGDVEFADPEIATAYDAVQALVLAPGRSAGGTSGILRTSTQQSANDLLTEPPVCLLHRQGSFAFGWLPEDTEFGSDGDIHFFVLPGVERGEAPLLIGSTSAVAFDDRPEVTAVLAHLASPGSTRVWSEAGGFVSPRRGSPADGEVESVDQAVRDLIERATVVRPDASDAMAPEVGSDLLWREITGWVADVATYDRLASTIDAARAEPPRA